MTLLGDPVNQAALDEHRRVDDVGAPVDEHARCAIGVDVPVIPSGVAGRELMERFTQRARDEMLRLPSRFHVVVLA
jgi:hypothetical protein